MYKAQVKRVEEKQNTANIESYLQSLELNIIVYIDDMNEITRIAQMTQKTNQFNLTTKRYTETDIESFIKNENKTVISISVRDKFGDNGIVGLAILEHFKNLIYIDTFLMSCRVLGRNIEYKFMDIIVSLAKEKKISIIKANYLATLKNAQVADLYDRCGFEIQEKTSEETIYQIDIKNYKIKSLNYIGVKSGKKN